MKILYIAGPPGSGKSTLDKNLRREYGVIGSDDTWPVAEGVCFAGRCRPGTRYSGADTVRGFADELLRKIDDLTISGKAETIIAEHYSTLPLRSLLRRGALDRHEIVILYNFRPLGRVLGQIEQRENRPLEGQRRERRIRNCETASQDFERMRLEAKGYTNVTVEELEGPTRVRYHHMLDILGRAPRYKNLRRRWA